MLPAPNALRRIVVAAVLLPALLRAAFAPQGGEYPISGPLPGDQTAPTVAIGPEGGWVAWQDNGLGRGGLGIGVRRIDANLQPQGSILRVHAAHGNPRRPEDNEKPSVSLLRDGGAAVAWQSGTVGFQNVYVRFLRPDGQFSSDQILVNVPASSHITRVTTNWMVMRNNKLRARTQRIRHTVSARVERTGGVSVATLSDGSVVVAYASERRVNTTIQMLVDRVRRIGGRSITNSVLTTVPSSTDTMQDVYFQRFTATGERIGAEGIANQFLPHNQRNPVIAARPDGTFVVAWVSELQGQPDDLATTQYVTRGQISDLMLSHDMDVMARIFANSGDPVGNEFVVNTADRPCGAPSVAASVGGGFTIVWGQKDAVASNSLDIYARAYSPAGNALTDGFLVNTHQYGDQFVPRIAAVPAGQIVVWTSLAQDGSADGVYARWLNDGTIASDEMRVNTTTYLKQFHPAVSGDAAGRALVVWSSYQTEAGFDLYGQRFTAQ